MISFHAAAIALPLALFTVAPASHAASNNSWDGTWSGMLNKTEPVSVTISGGKVVAYAIRGGSPFGIGYSNVTVHTVSFGDHQNYDVKITRTSAKTAVGVAHSSMVGDGSAPLTKE